jgi:hypothetical protein
MNRMLPPLLLLLVVSTASHLAGCQSAHHDDGGSNSADMRSTALSMMDQHTQGLLKRDTAALDRLWADDFAFINLRGQLLSKQDRLDNVRTGATSFKSIDVSEQEVHPLGKDGFVVTCRVKIEGQYSGAEGSGDYRCSLVGGRRQGDWKLVTVQMTRIQA